MFSKKKIDYKKLKKHPQKLLRKTQIHFFFLTAWAAQTAQTEEFIFQNVAYYIDQLYIELGCNPKIQIQDWKRVDRRKTAL